VVEVKSTTTLVVRPNSIPLSFQRKLEAAGKTFEFDCSRYPKVRW
jgi:hypothetical protein